MLFIAQFTGPCADCDEPLEEGQQGRMVDGEAVHAICPSIRRAPPRPVCPHCFLVHAVTQEDCDG